MQYYSYISTRACYDPAKTIFVFAPECNARNLESAASFAEISGWQAMAEYDSAVLILPIAANGWNAEPNTLPSDIYDYARNSFASRCGKSLLGRNGMLWCWETMIYWVGYEEGADFAGRCAVSSPNRFASIALINGAARDYSGGERSSSHWFVKCASADYDMKNNQIPVSIWLLGAKPDLAAKAVDYYSSVNNYDSAAPQKTLICGIPANRYFNHKTPAAQLLVSEGEFTPSLKLAYDVLTGFFNHTIRWKNSPDGTLEHILGRTDFYSKTYFHQTSVTVNNLAYSCAVHLPEGMSAAAVHGLPLVISLHGRGEPAWLFAEKNGWPELADKTRGFVLAVPDSPGNIWLFKRDNEAIGAIIEHICTRYQLDSTRVYLTGFSNGGSMTREAGSHRPELFAAIAPFNAPVHVSGIVMDDVLSPELAKSGYELPYCVTVGDNNPAAGIDIDEQLAVMLKVNGCALRVNDGLSTQFFPDEIRTEANWYNSARGYHHGDRFTTMLYYGRDGNPRVSYTVMKNCLMAS